MMSKISDTVKSKLSGHLSLSFKLPRLLRFRINRLKNDHSSNQLRLKIDFNIFFKFCFFI